LTKVALLDTTTVIAVLRGDPKVMRNTTGYLLEHSQLCFSIITQYEALRVSIFTTAQDNTPYSSIYAKIVKSYKIIQLDEMILDQAAMIYARLYRLGQLIDDADILIAATALVNDWRLITDNERHLRRIPGLLVENWSANKV
jgi:predicted nucleic acid-binding protein